MEFLYVVLEEIVLMTSLLRVYGPKIIFNCQNIATVNFFVFA